MNDSRAWIQTTTGIAGMLLLVQFLTGTLLAFYYVPSVDHAYTTVSYIEKVVSSGSWVRSLHHYGSQWLALFLLLHVVRLFFSETYIVHRHQWLASIAILGLVMAAAGTGYSLPWDARAFFSTRVAEGLTGGLPLIGRNARLWLLGGSEISTLTLSRFFALHVLVTPFAILAALGWRFWGARIAAASWPNLRRQAIAAGVVFLALALWSLKYPAPLGPAVETMSADYLPRPGAQFLWLYQSLKYVPGALGSLIGLVAPGIALLVLALLPWLNIRRRLVGGVILSGCVLLVLAMTIAAHLSDRRDQRTREQLTRQAAQEELLRREPFAPKLLMRNSQTQNTDGPPQAYLDFCANCHGARGEGARQGALTFPPLLDVAAKPRRTVDDIVALLKDPTAFGLQPPMRSFSSKLTEAEMRQIGEWIVRLKK